MQDRARTLETLLDDATRRLEEAGVPGARREAQLLLAHALDSGLGTILAYPERTAALDQAAAFDDLIAARAARQPISRILGQREFWSLPFRVAPAVLDPRPDSETLIQAVLDQRPDRDIPLRVLDLGTGSGCLLLALLSEYPSATGLGLERDPEAAAVARANAAALGLAGRAEIREADWQAGLTETFDVILCNPPYIPSADIPALAPEVVRHDPPGALDGGADGLDAYRALAPQLPQWLVPGGLAAFEVGQGQAEAVAALLSRSGLRTPPPLCDLAGIPRCVLAARPAA